MQAKNLIKEYTDFRNDLMNTIYNQYDDVLSSDINQLDKIISKLDRKMWKSYEFKKSYNNYRELTLTELKYLVFLDFNDANVFSYFDENEENVRNKIIKYLEQRDNMALIRQQYM